MKDISFQNSDISALLMRISLGVVMFGHGAQKLLGWFGGYGFEGTMQYFTESVGTPYIIGLLVIVGESIGAIALMVGILSRFVAISIFVIMIGAMFHDHLANGFFMNWFGNQKGEGYEFDLLCFGLCLAIILNGSGKYSIDHLLNKFKGRIIPA
jgi:putative oxidoreductase